MKLELSTAARFLEVNPPPGPVLVCAITGSHLYGFPSVDSDIDIKGIHLAPTTDLLGLRRPSEAFDRLEIFEQVECDLTTHEVGKALALLLEGNGNMLERIFSPFQVESPELEALLDLSSAALSQRSFGHYAGYFKGMKREHAKKMRAKSMLYTYRVALTGIHLLNTGEVLAHLPSLMEIYDYSELQTLIERKRAAEKLPLSAAESAPFEERWEELEKSLVEARQGSVLPLEPPDPDALHRWLIERRLAEL